MSDAIRIQEIERRLRATYQVGTWRSSGAPLRELIATILSQNTSDLNSGRAMSSLELAFPDLESLGDAEPEMIETAIASGGLAVQKSRSIRASVNQINKESGFWQSVEFLPLDQAQARLTALPGVGLKTASCVLLFSLGRPVVPVDTHVHRVATRLGLIPRGTSADSAHALMTELANGDRDRAWFWHMALINHGRDVCKSRSPLCVRCTLNAICPFFAAGTRFDREAN